MVKADRYTQDGREAIIKAQEAETEDKVYQIGEISQKTGLQKTANGWVKPKKGAAPAKKENPTRTFEFKAGPDGNPIAGSGKEVKTYKTKKEAQEALKKQNVAASKPALSQIDGKGNKVEIKITESKGGGFYVDKYVNGKQVGINNANTRESAEAKAKSMMEQHMADPDYKAEEKPAAGNNLPDIPEFKGMESGDYDKKLRAEGWTTGGWEGNGTHASAIFKKGDRTIRVNEGQPGKITSVQEINKPAAENKTVEKFDIEKWKTGPKVEKNSKLDWSHGVVGESIPVQGKSAEEKRNLINKYNSVGRLSRIGTKKNSYYNNKYGTFEVAGIDNDNVYIQEERSNGMGSRYMVLVTIPLNEVEEINPFHDYGKRNPDTGEESPTRPPLPEDAAPRVLTGDCRIRIRKEKPALTGDTKISVRK
jgi:hypothetical protein